MAVQAKTWRMKALTDIWTGDRTGNANRLITTGLLGSIRWWFEVVVRGVGGSACDPSSTQVRCPDRQGKRCLVCELFGCTSWARKFRFDVVDADGHAQQEQIRQGNTFQLVFTPLRPVRGEEWALLDVTMRLTAGYAAIGGKTVYKPSDETERQNAAHHRDYGVFSIQKSPAIDAVDLDKLRAYVSDRRWRRVEHGAFAWASLANFWSVSGRYLARQSAKQSTFNRVIRRPEPKGQAPQGDSWLAGRRAGGGQDPESKKAFSSKRPARTFGFTNGGEVSLDAIKTKLRNAWQDLADEEVRTGDAIVEDLLRPRGA